MTEKAKELFLKHYSIITGVESEYLKLNFNNLKILHNKGSAWIKAKDCTLLTVNEIINSHLLDKEIKDMAQNIEDLEKLKIEIEKL